MCLRRQLLHEREEMVIRFLRGVAIVERVGRLQNYFSNDHW